MPSLRRVSWRFLHAAALRLPAPEPGATDFASHTRSGGHQKVKSIYQMAILIVGPLAPSMRVSHAKPCQQASH
jgi:hypothetical protein